MKFIGKNLKTSPVLAGSLLFFCSIVLSCSTVTSTVTPRPIPKEAIARAVETRNSDYQACYSKFLGKKPRPGTVRIDFKVNSRGQATQARVRESTIQSSKLEACLAAIIPGILFPAAEEGMMYEVSYPFRFR